MKLQNKEKIIDSIFMFFEFCLIIMFVSLILNACTPLTVEVKQTVITSDKKEQQTDTTEYPLLSAIKKSIKKLTGK
jgi:hypothetical protein